MTAAWDEGSLGDVASFASGGTPDKKRSEFYGGDIPWISSADIVDGRVANPRVYLTDKGLRESAASLASPGQVLLVTRTGVGKVAVSPCALSYSQDITAINEDRGRIDRGYLVHYLRSRQQWLLDRARGATIKGVTQDVVRRMPIPLPPLEEQHRIARILDSATGLQAKRCMVNERLEALERSVFDAALHRFRDARVPLGEHLTFVTSGGRGWAKYYSDRGTRFIRSLDVRMNSITDDDAVFVTPPDNAEARRTRVMRGDVLLTITGSRIGRVAAVSDEMKGAYISQHVAILRPDLETLVPQFLAFFLSSPSGGQRQIAKSQYGQTKPGLNFEQIRAFEVPVPEVSVQREFLRRIEHVGALRAAHGRSRRILDQLFDSLLQQGLNAKL